MFEDGGSFEERQRNCVQCLGSIICMFMVHGGLYSYRLFDQRLEGLVWNT